MLNRTIDELDNRLYNRRLADSIVHRLNNENYGY